MSEDYTARLAAEVAMVTDNHQPAYAVTLDAACRAIREDSGYPELDPEDYAMVVRDRAHEFYAVVGDAVTAALVEHTAGQTEPGSTAALLLAQLLGSMTYAMGKQYLPEADVYADWYAENI